MHDTVRYKTVTPEEEFLLAAATGDQAAFGRLVREYQSPVRAFARRITHGDNARADDLAQDAFIKAWQKLASWRREGTLKSWLLGITWHIFLEEERKGTRRRLLDNKAPEIETRSLPTHDIRMDLERALAQLSPAESASISLCLRDGLTIREASCVLEMAEGTIKSHISRGRTRLKAILSGAEQGMTP